MLPVWHQYTMSTPPPFLEKTLDEQTWTALYYSSRKDNSLLANSNMSRNKFKSLHLLLFLLLSPIAAQHYPNPYPPPSSHILHPLPHTYLSPSDLPQSFTWQNVNGHNYLTRMRNQHIPQYCGACWAHAALSALADRVKIARSYIGPRRRGGCYENTEGQQGFHQEEVLQQLGPPPGPDIDLSVQFLLNCGVSKTSDEHSKQLSCHGGNSLYAYEYIYKTLGFVPDDSCLAYLACSSDSDEGWCSQVREFTSCDARNVCRSCGDFGTRGGKKVNFASDVGEAEREGSYVLKERDTHECRAIASGSIPNVTILEYGSIEPLNIHAIKAEIYARGPIKASINADYLRNYTGGILGSDDNPALFDAHHNHGVSIVGWGYDEERDKQHWIVRNSWGAYWVSVVMTRPACNNSLVDTRCI
ncbi:hypothetical protein ACHAWX_006169 [Stephanocyclus meneghinianus]